MDLASAAAAFSALGEGFRLQTFRAVARTGARGALSSEVSRDLDASPRRVAAALRVLRRSGVVESRRDGRFTRYTVAPRLAEAMDLVRPPLA